MTPKIRKYEKWLKRREVNQLLGAEENVLPQIDKNSESWNLRETREK